MNNYCGLFLVLCMSTLCIKNTSGSDSYGHSLFTHGNMAPIEELPLSHSVHKRQAELIQLRTCTGIISDEQCNNGLIQESINLALRCNGRQQALLLAGSCQRNSRGEYCSLAQTYQQDVSTLAFVCRDSVEACTTRCRNYLTLLREELGCCLNLAFNNTLSPLNSPALFGYALWSSCGVEPITEECSDTVRLPVTELDFACTAETYTNDAGALVCSERYLQPIFDRLSEDCAPYGLAALESCGVDESGQHCYERSSELNTQLAAAVSDCQGTDTSSCNETCVGRLEDVAGSAGCCVNNFLNGSLAGITSVGYDWLSEEYWSQCGIDSPGFCEARLNGAVSSRGSHVTTVVVAACSAVSIVLSLLYN